MHLKTTVIVPGIGDVDVSTVSLGLSGLGTGYETCLFWGERLSEVMAWYNSPALAHAGHAKWCDPALIAREIEAARVERE